MSRPNADEIRIAAEAIYNNTRPMNSRGVYQPPFDYSRHHAVNIISEDFLGGFMQDGRMSVVRRFFCLFVTFDLFFISLLWIICIMLHGGTILDAFQKQVVHYTIYTSLFDVVGVSICRFVVLVLFYGFFYMNHWSIVALSTTSSCAFLVCKVFFFDWVHSAEPVFGVVLVITSFVLSWGEAWFFDGRVIPLERHARTYLAAVSSNDRSHLLAPFLAAEEDPRTPEFRSTIETEHNSDAEDEMDDEYKRQGLDCVRKAYQLLQATDWKVEKVTQRNDTIQSIHREKLGKIYKLTGRIKYPAKALLEELFYKIEYVPKWNPTMIESKILRKINTFTDISYAASQSAGGGLVKSRDFVNLRCWRLCSDGKVIEDSDSEEYKDNKPENGESCEGSVSTISCDNDNTPSGIENSNVPNSQSSLDLGLNNSAGVNSFRTLSQSLGAKGFLGHIDFEDPPPLEDEFHDAEETAPVPVVKKQKAKERVYVSAAFSVDFPSMPKTPKYIRGENIVSCYAMREIEGKSDACIFEMMLCLDLKGYMPRYVLDASYTTFMADFMQYLRKYINELREKPKRSASHRCPVIEDD